MKKIFCTIAMGLLGPLAASAQDAVDAELFKPAIGGGLFGVDRAQLLAHGKIYLGAFVNYARNPLVVFTQENGEVFLIPVRDQGALDLVMSVGLWDRLEFGFAVPASLYIAGDDLTGNVQGGQIGDFRLNGKLSLLPKQEDPYANGLRLALQMEAKLPTSETFTPASEDGFLGDGSGAFATVALADFKTDRATFMGNFGVRFRGVDDVSLENITTRNELIMGGGLDLKISQGFHILGEIDGVANLDRGNDDSNPAEVRVGAKIGGGNIQVPFGVGVGVNNSLENTIDATDFRVFAGLTFGKDDPDRDGFTGRRDSCPKDREDLDGFEDLDGCPEIDNDNDLVMDASDQCPNSSEDFDSFQDADGCPELDNDLDAVADLSDSCPDEAEDKDGFNDADGCPDPDNDADGIVDASDDCPMVVGTVAFRGCMDSDGDLVGDSTDRCPNEAEDADGFNDADGCADLDNDSDGIADLLDFCPNQAENKDGTKDDDGCPDDVLAVVYCGELVILDKIFFDTNKTTIKSVSEPVLDAVIKALKEHTEVTMVRVEGNADDVGSTKRNQILSEGRANAVVAYLTKGGINPNRLRAVGNTESKPLAPIAELDPLQQQAISKARDKNRRVEFFVEGSTESSLRPIPPAQ